MRFIDRIIIKELGPHKKNLLFVLSLMLLTVGFQVIAPWPYKLIIDNVLGSEPLNNDIIGKFPTSIFKDQVSLGFFIVFIYFITNGLLSVFEYFQSLEMKTVIRQVLFDFSKSAFANLEQFNIGFFRKQSIGDYIYRLSYDVTALGEYVEEGILPILTSSLYLIVTTTIMFFISVKLTLLALVSLPFLTAGLYYFNKRIDTATKYSETWNSTVFSYVDQALNQLKVIQSFTQEQKTANKFDRTVHTSLKSDLRMYKLDFLLNLLVGLVIALSYSIIIANGISDVHIGVLTTGVLIVFIFYLDNLTNPVLEIIFATSVIKEAHVRIARMQDFFSKRTHTSNTGLITSIDDPSVRFDHVTLLADKRQPILHDISFNLPAGSFTVLVGVSGSGKTSIVSLIPRLINDPDKGDVYIGEHHVKEYSLPSLREAISYLPQEIVLFNDTVYNNIAFGKSNATKAEVHEAAKLACAHEFILKHKDGYDFQVGENGNFLSGGQRQRVLLARTFLKAAKIVILDEPLSYLDLETRSMVWKNIEAFSKGRTVLMVTNIMDVISKANQVIVINDGQLIEVGKHEDLLKNPKYYKLLARS